MMTPVEKNTLARYYDARLMGLTVPEARDLLRRYPVSDGAGDLLTPWDHLSFEEAMTTVERRIQNSPLYHPEVDRIIPREETRQYT